MGGWRKTEEGLVVIVAVDVTKEITDNALEWAIRNIVQPKDTLILLALLKSTIPSGKLPPKSTASSNPNNPSSFNQFVTTMLKKWGRRNDSNKINKIKSLEVSNSKKTNSGNGVDEEEMRRIIEVCLEMMNDLCFKNNVKQVRAQVKLLPSAQINSVAIKSEEYQASWVILDRCLKKESEYCSKQLNCNIIIIDHTIPKVLQLVNAPSTVVEEEESSNDDTITVQNRSKRSNISLQRSDSLKSSGTNTSSSLGFGPEQGAAAATSARGSESVNPTLQDYISIVPEGEQQDKSPEILSRDNISKLNKSELSVMPSNRKGSNPQGRRSLDSAMKHNTQRQPTNQSGSSFNDSSTAAKIGSSGAKQDPITSNRRSVDSAMVNRKTKTKPTTQPSRRCLKDNATTKFDRASSIRKAMSLSIKQPTPPPPLCSICKHKVPVFGKPPRKFSYEEIEKATDSFSEDNFLAEGGYGPVYKGVLKDRQVVAVKKHRKASAQGAAEFCVEVEVLSCAQHRNLVMLVGYCVEGKEWLLVYEFACNGSLDKHLHDKDESKVMAWSQRQKVAIGAARGLRYLHEDCRVGCIVHRDLRPKNILLTHDFEPMVGDFGLARCQMDGQKAEETRVVGTLGYLAPEYTQTGQITEKADVYAFGLLLIELISGLKAADLIKQEKLYHLQWATSLMQRMRMHDLIDPRLNGNYAEQEVRYMMHVAALCVSPDPEMRPRMSQVLRMLEGDMPSDNASHQQSQTAYPIPMSNSSYQLSQTTPMSRPADSHHRSQPPPPISRFSDNASHFRSTTSLPIHSRSSDITCDLDSQIPVPARSPIYSKGFNYPFEQSKFVQKIYGLPNEEHNNNANMMRPAPIQQTNTTGATEMKKVDNERIMDKNKDGQFAAQKYQVYLQESYFEFIQRTKGVAMHENS